MFDEGDRMHRVTAFLGIVGMLYILLLGGCMIVKTGENSGMDEETVVPYETIEFPEDETIETRVPNLHVTMYVEADVYEPDGIVKFHIVDPTNTGFMSDKNLELLEWNGEDWVKKRRVSPAYLPSIYKRDPNSDGTPIDVVGTLYLSDYQDIQRGKRYKITIGVEGYTLSAEFTVAVA